MFGVSWLLKRASTRAFTNWMNESLALQGAAMEGVVQELFSELVVTGQRTKSPRVIAMMGLTGSGKTAVARRVAKKGGGVIVSSDTILLCLRARGMSMDGETRIGVHARLARFLLEEGFTVILDGDYVTPESLDFVEWISGYSVGRPIYIRTVCDLVIQEMRIMAPAYLEGSIYAHRLVWNTLPSRAPPALACHLEMMRRIGFHYDFTRCAGGQQTLRSFDHIGGLTTIDTGVDAWRDTLDQAMASW